MPSSLNIERSRALRRAADEIARIPTLSASANRLRAAADDLLLPPLVVLVGAFNAGKSTLLNALLGQRLLATHVLPTTAVVSLLRKPRENEPDIQAYSNDERVWTGSLASLNSISVEGDTSYAELRGNLSHVVISVENPILDRATLVDTPGLNSPFEAHTQSTKSFLSRARIVIWVTSALQPMSKMERREIEALPPDCALIIAVNQVDELDPDEDSAEEVCRRIAKLTSRPDTSVIPLSAKQALESIGSGDGDLARSNWPSLLDHLRKLLDFVAPIDSNSYASHQALVSLTHALNQVSRERHELCLKLEDALARVERQDAELRSLHAVSNRISGSGDSQTALLHADESLSSCLAVQLRAKVADAVNDGLRLEVRKRELDQAWSDWHSSEDSLQDESERLEASIITYKQSGLFGGEPIFFKGKKNELIQWRSELRRMYSDLQQRKSALRVKDKEMARERGRLASSNALILPDLSAALYQLAEASVSTLNTSIATYGVLLQELEDLRPLSNIAGVMSETGAWGMFSSFAGDSTIAETQMGLRAAIQEQAAFPTQFAPRSLEPKPEPIELSYEATPPLRSSWRLRFALPALAALALCILGIVFLQRHLDQNTNATTPATPAPIEDGPHILSQPLDDISAIRQALARQRLTLVSRIESVPGFAGPPLRILRADCSDAASDCDRLFIFRGPHAIWSEGVTAGAELSSIASLGENSFSVMLRDQALSAELVRFYTMSDGQITQLPPPVASPESSTDAVPRSDASPSATLDMDHTSVAEQMTFDPTMQIHKAIETWANAMQSNDAALIAASFADHVERFYLKADVTPSFIRDYMSSWLLADGHRAKRFEAQDVEVSMVSPDEANVSLMKHLVTSGTEGAQEFVIRSRLVLRREQGSWKIASVRDFK